MGNDGFGLTEKQNWTNLNYYAKYFNVTTDEVKERLVLASKADSNFLETLNGRMDYYGPLWLSVTCAVLLFVSSSLSKRLWSHPGELLDFHLLTVGVVELLLYNAFQTVASWGFFKWRGIDGVKVSEMAALSGYSLCPLIPALLVSVIPLSLVQWTAFAASAVISCTFIYRNLWPILKTSPSIKQEQATLFITLLLGTHAIFFLALRIAFYRHLHATKP